MGEIAKPSPTTEYRHRYVAALLVSIAVITSAVVGWSYGQHFAQAKLNGIDDFGEALIASLFYDAGVYDLLPIVFAVIGAAIATVLIAFPLAVVRISEIYRRTRSASQRSRDELLKSQQHESMNQL